MQERVYGKRYSKKNKYKMINLRKWTMRVREMFHNTGDKKAFRGVADKLC